MLKHDVVWFRFQEQPELSNYNPSEFQMAIEEAFLADQGFTEKLMDDINAAAGNTGYDDIILKSSFKEVNGSNRYAGAGQHLVNQVNRFGMLILFFFCFDYVIIAPQSFECC